MKLKQMLFVLIMGLCGVSNSNALLIKFNVQTPTNLLVNTPIPVVFSGQQVTPGLNLIQLSKGSQPLVFNPQNMDEMDDITVSNLENTKLLMTITRSSANTARIFIGSKSEKVTDFNAEYEVTITSNNEIGGLKKLQ